MGALEGLTLEALGVGVTQRAEAPEKEVSLLLISRLEESSFSLTGLGGAGTMAGGGGLGIALPPLGSESLKLNCRKNSLVSLRRKLSQCWWWL